MKEVVQETAESNQIAAKAHFEQMKRNIAIKKTKWTKRINSVINS